MTAPLPWYKVKLALHGIPSSARVAAVGEMHALLSPRAELRRCEVLWDDALNRLTVEVETEGTSPAQAADLVAEEILELAAATSLEFNEIEVSVLTVDEL